MYIKSSIQLILLLTPCFCSCKSLAQEIIFTHSPFPESRIISKGWVLHYGESYFDEFKFIDSRRGAKKAIVQRVKYDSGESEFIGDNGKGVFKEKGNWSVVGGFVHDGVYYVGVIKTLWELDWRSGKPIEYFFGVVVMQNENWEIDIDNLLPISINSGIPIFGSTMDGEPMLVMKEDKERPLYAQENYQVFFKTDQGWELDKTLTKAIAPFYPSILQTKNGEVAFYGIDRKAAPLQRILVQVDRATNQLRKTVIEIPEKSGEVNIVDFEDGRYVGYTMNDFVYGVRRNNDVWKTHVRSHELITSDIVLGENDDYFIVHVIEDDVSTRLNVSRSKGDDELDLISSKTLPYGRQTDKDVNCARIIKQNSPRHPMRKQFIVFWNLEERLLIDSKGGIIIR